MVNNEAFGKRIQIVMEFYGISAATFADHMSVGRSSISHILNGRNKPSLDFVMKIIEAYPDVDLKWLLYGTGSFPKTNNIDTSSPIVSSSSSFPETDTTTKQDLFSHVAAETKEKAAKLPEPPVYDDLAIKNNTKIDRIVIFYNDGTFSSYQKS